MNPLLNSIESIQDALTKSQYEACSALFTSAENIHFNTLHLIKENYLSRVRDTSVDMNESRDSLVIVLFQQLRDFILQHNLPEAAVSVVRAASMDIINRADEVVLAERERLPPAEYEILEKQANQVAVNLMKINTSMLPKRLQDEPPHDD